MDSIKAWLVEVALKKLGPSLIKGALAAVVGLLVAHQNLLAGVGLVYDAPAQTITLHLSTLSEWILTAGLGLIMAVLTGAQHHAAAAVTEAPHTGETPNDSQGGSQ